MDNVFKEPPKARLVYLDNVRSLVIFLVISMHTAVTYSGLGGWYYIEGSASKLSVLEMAFLGFFQSFLQAWFMGILFFISAYFTVITFEKRSTFSYIKERLFRLGVPLLIYVFIISPFILFVLLKYNSIDSLLYNYIYYLKDFWWLGSTGPLWFVQILLILSIIYAILKLIIKKPIQLNSIKSLHIVLVVIITAIIAFFVRLIFPIGSSYLNLQFGYFPSYIVMFIAGLIIGENNLLENLTDDKNLKWLKLTFVIGIPMWVCIMTFGEALKGESYYNGGLNWENLAYSIWELFTAISFSIGIIVFFKKYINIENKFTRLIQENAFGIYCFHAPILVIISLCFKHIIISPILKFLFVLIIASIICLIFSFIIRKIRPIGKIYR